jgi:hypothetical protein
MFILAGCYASLPEISGPVISHGDREDHALKVTSASGAPRVEFGDTGVSVAESEKLVLNFFPDP